MLCSLFYSLPLFHNLRLLKIGIPGVLAVLFIHTHTHLHTHTNKQLKQMIGGLDEYKRHLVIRNLQSRAMRGGRRGIRPKKKKHDLYAAIRSSTECGTKVQLCM